MLGRIAVIALVGLVVGCGSSAMAGRQDAHTTGSGRLPCGPASAHTLARDSVARVYVSRGYVSRGSVFGCASGGRGAVLLGRSGFSCVRSALVGAVRVAGRLAGLSVTTCGVDTGSTTVEVVRLSDGRRLVERPATTRVGVEGHEEMGSLVLRSDGGVAWIATARSIGPPHLVREVARVDRRGFAVLDSGSAVVAGSLRLSGSVLSWRHGSARRSAALR